MLFCLLSCVCFGRHTASAQPCDIKGQTGIFLHKVTIIVFHLFYI